MDPVWEKLYSSREWGKYPAEDLIRTVMRTYKGRNLSEMRVLEVGCGAGANLSFFLQEGFRVCGIDGAPSAIAAAKKRFGRYCQNGMLELGVHDFTKLPFDDQCFDIVVDYLAIYTNRWADIKSAHQECYRVLKESGHLYSRCWALGCRGCNTGNFVEPGTSENPTEGPCSEMGMSHFFSETEIREICSIYSSSAVRKIEITNLGGEPVELEWAMWAQK